MKTSQTPLTDAVLMAQLLERMERGGHPDADQYRMVVRRLADKLGRVNDVAALNALLEAHPATAELYENINYQHAGLCRSLLDASLAAEISARTAISRAKQPTSHDAA